MVTGAKKHLAGAYVVSLLAGVLTGCAWDGVDSWDLSPGESFGKAAEKLRPYAEPIAIRRYQSIVKQHRFIYGYCAGYESALKSTDGSYFAGSERKALNQGVQAGRKEALADRSAGALKATLLDFGFSEVEASGMVRLAFEMAEFRPDQAKARWWVYPDDALSAEYDRLAGHPNQKGDGPPLHVRLRGFLSPEDAFGVGHMNMYDREFVVSETLEVTAPIPSSQPR